MAEISPNWNALYSNQGIRLQGNPALDDLRQRYATQQAQQIKDNDNLTSEIAKLNFGGSLDSDLPDLQKQYGGIVNKFGKYRNTNDPNQRAQLGLEIQQDKNSLLYNIAKSNEANKENMQYAHLPLNPNADLADGANAKILQLQKLTSSDPKRAAFIQDLNNNLYNKPVDLSKLSLDAFNGVKDTDKETGEAVNDKVTGELKTPTYSTTTAKKDDFTKTLLTKIQGTKGADKQIIKSYPGMEIGQATEQFINDAWGTHQNKLGTDTTYSQPFETGAAKAARTLENEKKLAEWKHKNGIGALVSPTPVPQTVPITFKNTNPDKSPVTMNIRNYTPISIPKATMIPTKGTDDNGNEVSIPAGEVRVIGQGEKPVLNADITSIKNGVKSTVKKGSIVQPAYEAAHPDQVAYEKIYHVQQDHKGHTKNYYIPVTSLGINNSGQKSQTQAIQQNKKTDPLGLGL